MTNRKLEDGNEIDRDALDTDDDVPYDKLMAMLSDSEDGEDGVAFGAGEANDAALDKPVSVEDGLDLIEDAEAGKRKSAKVEDAPDPASPKPDEAAPEPEAPKAEDTQPAAQPDELDTLLTGLDDTARTTIKARVTAADEVMAVFKGRDAELKSLGVTPHEAMAELIKINSYARSRPDEYLAWAATQFGDPAEVLGKAAERLGMKLVANVPEDDPFEDPGVKEMRAKLATYEAREKAPALGPDAPQNRALTDLQAFQQQAPHFQTVAPQVAALAQAHVQTNGKPATMDDIRRFYDVAVMVAGLAPVAVPAPAPATIAAQSAPVVPQQTQKTTAAPLDSVQRAKAASRSLDGSGQGAGRRPAIAPDASLESVLSTIWDEQAKR